jgi:hypothetical protein
MGIYVSYTLSLLVIILPCLTSCQKGSLDSEIGRQILALNPSVNSQASCVVYRLEDSYPGSDEAKKEKYLHGYSILAGPIDLSIENRKVLHSIIESRSTYVEHSVPVDCSFLPGVAFCFADKQNRVDLLICFTCNELRYYLNGKVLWHSYFNSGELKDFVKKLFPQDGKIQSQK